MGDRERKRLAEGLRARGSCWRAVQVRPAAEFRVVEALIERHGVNAHAPAETGWRGQGVRKHPHRRPIFRGYVFAQLTDERAHLVHEVDGATRLYAIGGRPVRIDPLFVEKFRRAEAMGVFDKTLSPKQRHRLKAGDLVELVDGPFGGFLGAVLRLNGERRVKVLITLFGRMTEVEVGVDEVMLAEKAA